MILPHKYPRRVLLCVIGMTPQLVTETLYKLGMNRTSPWIPTEVHLITTVEGARSAQNALLGVAGQEGEFIKFCKDYSMPEIDFTPENIHVINSPDGLYVDDTQSSNQSAVTADFITETVRRFTQDDTCAIHLSLAGGRKTMSYYSGYALSLFGRMQDRLSHVLVAKPFQENEKFFYPPPKAKRLAVDNIHYSTDEANIILSDLPFVRLRYQVPERLLKGKAGFQETVESIQRFAKPETIEINVAEKEVRLNGMKVEMDDAKLAFYLWMCERKKGGAPPLVPNSDLFFQEYFSVYARLTSEMSGMIERLEKTIIRWKKEEREQNKTGQPKKWFQVRVSKVKNAIKLVLGDKGIQLFLIHMAEYQEQVGYEIGIKAESITIL